MNALEIAALLSGLSALFILLILFGHSRATKTITFRAKINGRWEEFD